MGGPQWELKVDYPFQADGQAQQRVAAAGGGVPAVPPADSEWAADSQPTTSTRYASSGWPSGGDDDGHIHTPMPQSILQLPLDGAADSHCFMATTIISGGRSVEHSCSLPKCLRATNEVHSMTTNPPQQSEWNVPVNLFQSFPSLTTSHPTCLRFFWFNKTAPTLWQQLAAVCPPSKVPADRPYQLFVFGCCLDAGTCNSTSSPDSCSRDFLARFGARWAIDCTSFKLGVPPTMPSDWQWNRLSNRWFRAGGVMTNMF